MLKKNQPIGFLKPYSSMRQVYLAIEHGYRTVREIEQETSLKNSSVKAAIANLAYIGAIITRQKDGDGRAIYSIPQARFEAAMCLRGINSIFSVITKP
jgi:predicted transcriptional regulator